MLFAEDRLCGSLTHPTGIIRMSLEQKEGELHGSVNLPAGLEGEFCFNGQLINLDAGSNSIRILVLDS